MARSLNKAMLVGYVGKDPEVKHTNNGTAICNFSVATTESWKDQQGAKQERTEWHRITVWKRLAEIVGEYVRKGTLVYVEGRIETRKWQDNDGNDRYTTEIIAREVLMLGSKDQAPRQTSEKPKEQSKPAQNNDDDSDIPF